MIGERPRGLYALADGEALGGAEHVAEAAGRMARAGVRHLQWRVKQASDGDRWASLAATLESVAGTGAAVWVDDRVDLALCLRVFGVHLGQRDLPPGDARTLLGSGTQIGWSTHDRAQIDAAAADPAVDWIAVGPIFPTGSKRNAEPAVGLELLGHARRSSTKPIVAIGGIDAGNAASVLDAGADVVAVLSAICRGDIERNVHQLLEAIA